MMSRSGVPLMIKKMLVLLDRLLHINDEVNPCITYSVVWSFGDNRTFGVYPSLVLHKTSNYIGFLELLTDRIPSTS